MPRKYLVQEVKDKLKEKELYMVDDEYINSSTKFDIIDNEGYKYSILFKEYMQYNTRLDKFSSYNPHTIENIKLWLKINGYTNKLLSTEYKHSNDRLVFTCKDCRNPYKSTFLKFRQENHIRCETCSKEEKFGKRRNTKIEVENLFLSKGLIIIDTDNYINSRQKIKVVNGFGYKGVISYNSLLANKGFKIFDKTNPYTIDNINNYLKINNLDCKLLSNEYKSARTKLEFQCSCGESYFIKLNHLVYQSKTRCNRCSKKQSQSSYDTEQICIKYNFNYKLEYLFDNCKNKRRLPFDCAILDSLNEVKILIELDGKQHFEPVRFNGMQDEIALETYKYTKNNDKIKDKYCIDNKIPLLRIPYWAFNNIEDILLEYINKISA